MKDLIQQAGEEVSIVIYDAPLPPKYFRFSKRFVKTLFIVVPLLITIACLSLFVWGLGTRLDSTPRPSIPQVINDNVEDSKMTELENEIIDLRTSNAQLTDKLAALPTITTSEDPFLMLIKKPYGMQNLLSQNKVSLDQFELVEEPTKIALKFQIISTNPETRVTGHVIVFMISGSGIMAYPKEANISMTSGIKYSLGEPFSVSRLRPTNAEFFTKPSGDSVKFAIYILSREGDLLLIRETQPFKLGAKQ